MNFDFNSASSSYGVAILSSLQRRLCTLGNISHRTRMIPSLFVRLVSLPCRQILPQNRTAYVQLLYLHLSPTNRSATRLYTLLSGGLTSPSYSSKHIMNSSRFLQDHCCTRLFVPVSPHSRHPHVIQYFPVVLRTRLPPQPQCVPYAPQN